MIKKLFFRRFVFRFFLLVFLAHCVAVNVFADASLKVVVQQLPATSLKNLPGLVEILAGHHDELAKPILEALLSGRLYYQVANKTVFIVVEESDDKFRAYEALSEHSAIIASKSEFKKIRTNNKIRSILRQAISRINLHSVDADMRLLAVRHILQTLTAEKITLLVSIRAKETRDDILTLIDTAIALGNVNSTEQAIRLKAIAQLSTSLEPVVKNQLNNLLEKDAQDKYLEPDVLVRQRVQHTLLAIEKKTHFYQFIETLFFGVSLGSVLLLAATGLAITFGVMGIINMAHGELMMIGAYTTYVVQQLMPDYIEWSIAVAVPAAFMVAALVGLGIERCIIRFLHGCALETLLATFGVSLILQQAVRTIFSPLNRQVETPLWMSGSLEINAVLSLTYNRIYIIIFAVLVFVVMQAVFKKTSLGLYVRAVSQNRHMANAMGVRSDRIDAMTFALGSGIAGVAGVALSQLTNVGPNLGQAYIIDSFMVVVFGGVGNLWGTLFGSLSLGIANKFLEPTTGTVLAKIIVLVFIILFIQKRPKGLFPQKGREVEV